MGILSSFSQSSYLCRLILPLKVNIGSLWLCVIGTSVEICNLKFVQISLIGFLIILRYCDKYEMLVIGNEK